MTKYSKILFKEEQRYRPTRVRVILPVVLATAVVVFGMGIGQQFSHKEELGTTPADNSHIIWIGIFAVVAIAFTMFLLFRMKMLTVIDNAGIHIHYPPIWKKGKFIGKESIKSFRTRKYRARFEYGGYGFKRRGNLIRRKKYGIAFTAYGKTGIQFELVNGDKILIGTQREQAFIYALEKMKKENG